MVHENWEWRVVKLTRYTRNETERTPLWKLERNDVKITRNCSISESKVACGGSVVDVHTVIGFRAHAACVYVYADRDHEGIYIDSRSRDARAGSSAVSVRLATPTRIVFVVYS